MKKASHEEIYTVWCDLRDEHTWSGQSYKDRKQMVVARVREGDRGLVCNRYRVLVSEDKNNMGVNGDDSYTIMGKYFLITEQYT